MYDREGNPVKDQQGNDVPDMVTDVNGECETPDLFYDDYRIYEIGIDGGNLEGLRDPIEVSLPMRMSAADAATYNLDTSDPDVAEWSEDENCWLINQYTFTVRNNRQFDMPMSGATFNKWLFLPLGLGMTAFVGIALFLFRKKKAVKAD